MANRSSDLGGKEFIALMALLMSLTALSIDAMLPALSQIGTSLGVENANDNQLILSTIFLGMSLGIMIYGPLSDSFGRKKPIYLGISIFIIGDAISLMANDFSLMLIGRFLQGFGAAACRVVTMAMIRDKFEGKEMARVMSLIMMVFIMVPALAPSVGQLLLQFFQWRSIFFLLLAYAVIALIWLRFRQPETLVPSKRIPFSTSNILSGIKQTLSHPITLSYTLASGIIFGAFIGFLSSSQQILQQQYQTNEWFSVYFGFLALSVGISSFINSRLVMKFSMESLCLISLLVLSVNSIVFYIYASSLSEQPSLFIVMVYLSSIFMCFGALLGNLNTMALHPMGHIAGIANSVISSVATLISVVIGTLIGQSYNGSVEPLILGFLSCGLMGLVIILRIKYSRNFEPVGG